MANLVQNHRLPLPRPIYLFSLCVHVKACCSFILETVGLKQFFIYLSELNDLSLIEFVAGITKISDNTVITSDNSTL